MSDQEPTVAARILYRIYKSFVSPLMHVISPSQCVYLPTCSEYAYVALTRFGAVRGGWLALRRLARCHPFSKGGFDPVPERNSGPSPSVTKGEDHLP